MRALSTLLLTTALAFAGCGGETSTPAAEPNGVDRAFAEAMVPHHEGAVEMAELARRRGESAFVRDLAANIVRSQEAEIATLRKEAADLERDGIAAGDLGVAEHDMGMDHDIAALRTAGSFDTAFLEMMIPHHEGAIAMAEAELAKGGDAELRALAEDIIEAQEREIAAMREHLGEPAGGDGGGHEGHGG